MKLKELENYNFNIKKEININVSLIFFEYGEKDINDLLIQYVKNPNIFNNKLTINTLKNLDYIDEYKLSTEVIHHFYHVLFDQLKDQEKEELINLCLDENRVFMTVLLSNPKIQLTDKQFDRIFNIDVKELFNPHNNYTHKEATILINMKLSLIENDNIFISDEKIYHDFFEKYSKFSHTYSKRKNISKVSGLMDKLLSDDIYVGDLLENILQEKNLTLSESQITKILDEHGFIERYYLSKNDNIRYTDEQVIKGILDSGFSDEEYESEIDNINNIDSNEVSYNFLKNNNIIMNENIINAVLKEKNDNYYINGLLEREDIKKSEELKALILTYKDKNQKKYKM